MTAQPEVSLDLYDGETCGMVTEIRVCTKPIGECTEHLECIGAMVKEMHTVLIFLGRKAKEMEGSPIGRMLSRFGG